MDEYYCNLSHDIMRKINSVIVGVDAVRVRDKELFRVFFDRYSPYRGMENGRQLYSKVFEWLYNKSKPEGIEYRNHRVNKIRYLRLFWETCSKADKKHCNDIMVALHRKNLIFYSLHRYQKRLKGLTSVLQHLKIPALVILKVSNYLIKHSDLFEYHEKMNIIISRLRYV